jgi:hypothetical protein
MTTASQQVQFVEASCQACRRKFSMPVLSDFSYGEFILHGERNCVFGFLCAHNEPAWEDIETRLKQAGLLAASPTRTDIDHFHRVIASSADAISGQRLVPFPVCPSCGSRSVAYGDSKPHEIGDFIREDIREIPRVTFEAFQLLSDATKTERVGELWRQLS